MQVSATEANKRFGSLCAQAKRAPVLVERAGQLDTKTLSVEQRQALRAARDTADRATHKTAFETEFGGWIAAQNARFEAHGMPGADLRPW